MKKRGRIVAFFLIVIVFFATIGTTVTGIAKDINLGLDLQGGFEVLYEVEPVDEEQEISRTITAVIYASVGGCFFSIKVF